MYFIIIFILLIITITITIIIFFTIKPIYESFSDKKTFSNTQKWGSKEYDFLQKLTPLGKQIIDSIPHTPFPHNNTTETKIEIQNIKNKMENRTEKQQKNIENELYLTNMIDNFNASMEDKYIIYNIMKYEINSIIMKVKEKYNRVRPYHLDDTIKPTIEPPKHPSYPSGHSTQSYFIAYILSEKYPDKREQFLKIAHQMSVNREYAGVHYESDTKFGKLVAKKIFEYFSNNNNPLL